VSISIDYIRQKASERKTVGSAYVGDVLSSEIWQYLQENHAFIVDVRTNPELKFVGTPDLTNTKTRLISLEWLRYPDFEANPHFITDIMRLIQDETASIFFLCKTGGRSAMAANAAAQFGYKDCFNIMHGFEGDHDENLHRGSVNGWKAEGLPWKQP
jgi:rhodanese-related sulfurtransferase